MSYREYQPKRFSYRWNEGAPAYVIDCFDNRLPIGTRFCSAARITGTRRWAATCSTLACRTRQRTRRAYRCGVNALPATALRTNVSSGWICLNISGDTSLPAQLRPKLYTLQSIAMA
jgi:hypothetical protein